MKITLDPDMGKNILGLCIGIIAVRAVDNSKANSGSEAFRHRCCTETNLMLKMNPHFADKDIDFYRGLVKAVGISGETAALESLFHQYTKDLQNFQNGGAPAEPAAAGIQKASFSDLIGSDILPQVNPVTDLIQSGMLKFHVDIHGVEVKDGDKEITIQAGEKPGVYLDGHPCNVPWLCKSEGAGVMSNSPAANVIILVTGLMENRNKVAAARNELARRLRDAFERSVEVGWLEGKTNTFETTI